MNQDSSLVSKVIPATYGHYSVGRRGNTIQEITLHHVAGNLSITQIGELWQTKNGGSSSHYGINNHEIGQYVRETNIAYTNGDWLSNTRAVTIEIANNGGSPEWSVSEDSLDTAIELIADIAKRNNLFPLIKGKNLTWHNMYTATICPGPYLTSKLDYIVQEANKRSHQTNVLYCVQVGAFQTKEYAQEYAKKLHQSGFQAIVKEERKER